MYERTASRTATAAESELSSDEGLARHLAEYLKANGQDVLSTLPDGIHSGLHKLNRRGVFLYYQAPAFGRDVRHFWWYYDLASGAIEDNRLVITELIRCAPDEPRVVDPAIKAEIHTIMQVVEESIVAAARHESSVRAAPYEISADQSAALVVLQHARSPRN